MKHVGIKHLQWRTIGMALQISLLLIFCSGYGAGSTGGKGTKSSIKEIVSFEEFTTIVEKSGNNLIAFDLYADWCMPCRILTPVLEKIAAENKSRVTFYRVNVDKVPRVSAAFNVTGIPLVVFIRNKEAAGGLMGVQPAEEYLKVINGSAPAAAPENKTAAKGGSMDNISVAQAQAFIADAKPFILDVRSEREFEEGYIEGAKLIPVNELADRAGELAAYKDKDILAYCYSGSRSLSAQTILSRQGFTKVHNLAGGIMVWKRNGFPLTVPKPDGN